MYSSRCGLNQRIVKQEQIMCDAEYFSEMISKPVNMFTALGYLPENSLVLKILPSSQHLLHTEIQAPAEMDQSAISLDVSQTKEFRERSGLHKRLASASSQPYSEGSMNESLGLCHSDTEMLCQSTARSFCHALGELHNLGINCNHMGFNEVCAY